MPCSAVLRSTVPGGPLPAPPPPGRSSSCSARTRPCGPPRSERCSWPVAVLSCVGCPEGCRAGRA
eukprot:15431581-Alexandrium_andersonii.AAC.1